MKIDRKLAEVAHRSDIDDTIVLSLAQAEIVAELMERNLDGDGAPVKGVAELVQAVVRQYPYIIAAINPDDSTPKWERVEESYRENY